MGRADHENHQRVRQGLEKLKRIYALLGVPEEIEPDFFDGPHEWSNGKTLEFLAKHFAK